MAYIVMVYIVMAYVLMAYIAVVYVVMAFTVMAPTTKTFLRACPTAGCIAIYNPGVPGRHKVMAYMPRRTGSLYSYVLYSPGVPIVMA